MTVLIYCKTVSHLADDAIAQNFRRHVVDGAGGLCLDAALDVHVSRQAKVRDLHAEAVGRIRRGRQQHVACTQEIQTQILQPKSKSNPEPRGRLLC